MSLEALTEGIVVIHPTKSQHNFDGETRSGIRLTSAFRNEIHLPGQAPAVCLAAPLFNIEGLGASHQRSTSRFITISLLDMAE
jgi:hypothetical protein